MQEHSALQDIITEWERDVLSPICLNECTQTCCAGRGQLIEITPCQALKIFKVNDIMQLPLESAEHMDARLTRHWNGNYVMSCWQSRKHPYCNAYDPADRLCDVEEDKPDTCRVFPRGEMEGKTIPLSVRCYAVQETDAPEKLKEMLEEIGYEARRGSRT